MTRGSSASVKAHPLKTAAEETKRSERCLTLIFSGNNSSLALPGKVTAVSRAQLDMEFESGEVRDAVFAAFNYLLQKQQQIQLESRTRRVSEFASSTDNTQSSSSVTPGSAPVSLPRTLLPSEMSADKLQAYYVEHLIAGFTFTKHGRRGNPKPNRCIRVTPGLKKIAWGPDKEDETDSLHLFALKRGISGNLKKAALKSPVEEQKRAMRCMSMLFSANSAAAPGSS